MKESLWGYYLVLLGITVSTVMILVSNMTTTNQQNYYLIKEVTNAAMIDAIDYGYYRAYGEMKINTEKFVENFIRRFSEGVSKTNTYKIDFYSIYENPPSVSVRVSTNTGEFHIEGDSSNINVINSIDAIMEANNTITYSETFYSIPYAWCDESNFINNDNMSNDYGYCQLVNRAQISLKDNSTIVNSIRSKLPSGSTFDKSKIKILNVEYLKVMDSNQELQDYYDSYDNTYVREHSVNDVPRDKISVTSNYLAKNVKDVRVTMKKDDENNYYLAYGLNFNCDGADTFKYYRKGTTIDDMVYVTESGYNSLADKTGYNKAPFYGNCMIGIKYKINFYYDTE